VQQFMDENPRGVGVIDLELINKFKQELSSRAFFMELRPAFSDKFKDEFYGKHISINVGFPQLGIVSAFIAELERLEQED
jgi:hypothetical protein